MSTPRGKEPGVFASAQPIRSAPLSQLPQKTNIRIHLEETLPHSLESVLIILVERPLSPYYHIVKCSKTPPPDTGFEGCGNNLSLRLTSSNNCARYAAGGICIVTSMTLRGMWRARGGEVDANTFEVNLEVPNGLDVFCFSIPGVAASSHFSV